jgi:hypothetical protein
MESEASALASHHPQGQACLVQWAQEEPAADASTEIDFSAVVLPMQPLEKTKKTQLRSGGLVSARTRFRWKKKERERMAKIQKGKDPVLVSDTKAAKEIERKVAGWDNIMGNLNYLTAGKRSTAVDSVRRIVLGLAQSGETGTDGMYTHYAHIHTHTHTRAHTYANSASSVFEKAVEVAQPNYCQVQVGQT